jgi:NAD-dependent deacetylase
MSIAAAAELLRSSKRTLALTGAGFSTPSGVPDFRSPGSGLWRQHDPLEVASLTTFRTHPERFFEWVHPLAVQILQAQPNAAHTALAALEAAQRLHATVTQNIDGLHQRAGAQNVIEIHGSLASLTCVNCLRNFVAKDFLATYLKTRAVPRCPACGGVLKPDAVLFEEQLPFAAWQRAQQAARDCELILVLGSSLEVMPVAGLPLRALEAGAKLVIINREETYLDERAEIVLRGDVAEALPAILAELS